MHRIVKEAIERLKHDKELIGKEALKLAQWLVEIDESYREEAEEAARKRAEHIQDTEIKHMYPNEIVDEEAKNIFIGDQPYSVAYVSKLGYCSFVENTPCEKGTEAFYCDARGRTKKLFTCPRKIQEHTTEILCEHHLELERVNQEKILQACLSSKEERMINLVIDFAVSNLEKLNQLRTPSDRTRWIDKN
jgi:hypothetical protein